MWVNLVHRQLWEARLLQTCSAPLLASERPLGGCPGIVKARWVRGFHSAKSTTQLIAVTHKSSATLCVGTEHVSAAHSPTHAGPGGKLLPEGQTPASYAARERSMAFTSKGLGWGAVTGRVTGCDLWEFYGIQVPGLSWTPCSSPLVHVWPVVLGQPSGPPRPARHTLGFVFPLTAPTASVWSPW